MEGVEHIPHGDEATWLSTLGVCGVDDLQSPVHFTSSRSDSDSGEDIATCDGEVRLDVSSEDVQTPQVHLSEASDDDSLADGARLSDSDSQSHDGSAAVSLHAPAHAPSGWTVGQNCGSWISEANGLRPLVAQSCVLLMNVYWNVRRLSRDMQTALVDILGISMPARACVGDYLTGALCGVSQSRVCRLYRRSRNNGWCPGQPADGAVVGECAPLGAKIYDDFRQGGSQLRGTP